MEPARILLISQSGQFGGAEKRIVEEAWLLASLGYQVKVMTPDFLGVDALISSLPEHVKFETLAIPPFLRQWRFRSLNRVGASVFSQRKLLRQKADLAHIFFTWSDQGLEPLWLASLCGIPSIASARNTFPIKNQSPWITKHLRSSFSHLRGLYGISQAALDGFEGLYGNFMRSDTLKRLIYNSVDTTTFKPNASDREKWRSKLGIADSQFHIGSVGRIDTQKQPDYLIEIFDHLYRHNSNLRLTLVGSGNMRETIIRSIKDRGLSKVCQIIPYTDSPETIYPSFDMHLLASRNEGFGTVTAEAMACGVPVVGTDVPGTNEVIKNGLTGLLISKEDALGAATDILSVISQPQKLSSTSFAASDFVKTNFSKTVWKDQITALYQDVLENTNEDRPTLPT